MRLAIDFDGTVVVQEGRAYNDVNSPLEFMPGAREALYALKRAGHLMLLWSARSSPALLFDPYLDPFVRAGVRPANMREWRESRAVHRQRQEQMLRFVDRELQGVFDAIDDGRGGKPSVDLFIDDKALRLGWGGIAMAWPAIARVYGDFGPDRTAAPPAPTPLLDQEIAKLDLTITGRLGKAIETVRGELAYRGIRFAPNFYLGDGDFWTYNKSISINVPWFLANDDLWDLVRNRDGLSYDDVLRTLRHEVGHAVNYAFELWKLPDWEALFGEFTAPYRENFPVDTASKDDFVAYLRNVPKHYGQKHPDEDWSETFAAWLDPTSRWHDQYADRPVALAKLLYVDGPAAAEMRDEPVTLNAGQMNPYRTLKGTVRDALSL